MIDRLEAVAGRDVSRETFQTLERFVALLVNENQRQNLIAAGSVDEMWERHIVDGAQLLALADRPGSWCDIGSGPGLPGLVVAILSREPMTLVEPRRLRTEFLQRSVAELGLDQVRIEQRKAEQVRGRFDFVTARAVANLSKLFALSGHLSHSGTRWILPKGEKAKSELDEARRTWQGSFRLVPSQTRPQAAIIVAESVKPRGKQ